MANTVTSPNMNLPVPVVAVDPGPDWAINVDACLNAIDSHNHTTGQGVPITPAAININSDLLANNNNITTVRALRFQPQGSAPSDPADLGEYTMIGVDSYFIDGSGNLIRMTQSGAPAGATGTITGLPSGTASASFAGTTFTFQSSTNTPASLAVGPTTIAQAVASGFGVTISASGSQTLNYNMTLPIALPTTPAYIQSDSSGNLSFIDNANWTNYSPTLTAGITLTGPSIARYRRVGQSLEIYVDFQFSAAAAAATNFTVSLPPGLTSAGSNYPNGSNTALGDISWQRFGGNQYAGVVQYNNTTSINFATGHAASTAGGPAVVTISADQLSPNDFLGFSCSLICDQFT